MAEALNTRQATYSEKEQGLSEFSLSESRKVADMLGLSIDQVHEKLTLRRKSYKNEEGLFNVNDIVGFLEDTKEDIEDMLFTLGRIGEPKVSEDILNYHIQARFKDALMYFNTGQTEKLEKLLKKAADEDWI